MAGFVDGWDFNGGDLPGMGSLTWFEEPSACCQRCSQVPGCGAWTWNMHQYCSLKYATGWTKTPASDRVSGYGPSSGALCAYGIAYVYS